MTKHVSKAGKVDPSDRVTLPVKFACKPELTLTFFLDYLSTRVTLSPCKQALNEESESRFNSNTIDEKQLGIWYKSSVQMGQ